MTETWQIVFGVLSILLAILFLMAAVMWIAKPWPPKKPLGDPVVWHQLPAIRGDGSLPCCGRYPDQIPNSDMISKNPHQVTCGRIPGQPRRAAA